MFFLFIVFLMLMCGEWAQTQAFRCTLGTDTDIKLVANESMSSGTGDFLFFIFFFYKW